MFARAGALAAKRQVAGGIFCIREQMETKKAELQKAILARSAIDCKVLAKATLCANSELDDYKIAFLLKVLEARGRATATLQTDRVPAAVAFANAVRDRKISLYSSAGIAALPETERRVHRGRPQVLQQGY